MLRSRPTLNLVRGRGCRGGIRRTAHLSFVSPACDEIAAIEQLGLFDGERTHLAAARRDLARFDLLGAERNLAEHARRSPGDQAAQSFYEEIRRLRVERDAAALAGAELGGLLEIEAAVPAYLRDCWHRCVAEVAEAEAERGALLRAGGEPLGFHWLAAGERGRAIESLHALLEVSPRDGRARAVLADALWASGEEGRARREYFRAFADEPPAIAIERVADPAVARLVDLACGEYELPEPGVAWVPAVGVVERVFALPQSVLPGLALGGAPRPPPLEFIELIARERAGRTLDERVVVRRRMKALAPKLLEAYLSAWVLLRGE